MNQKVEQEKRQEGSSIYEEPFQVIRKKEVKSRRLLKTIREKDSCYKFYSWDIMENYAYIAYLINFRHIFDSQLERKRIKVFRHLSKLIKTRNPHQIKSHHQKMMLRHLSVDAIIEFVRSKITKEIRDCPELIPIIRRINQEAQLFFLKEVSMSSISDFSKAPLNNSSFRENGDFQSPENSQVKVEEAGQSKRDYLQVKMEELEGHGLMPNIKPCLKQEEVENVIWQKCD